MTPGNAPDHGSASNRGGGRDRAIEAAVGAAARLLGATAGGRPGKLGQGIRGRRDAADRLIEWRRTDGAGDGPLVWLHAPSVGEALMARAIVAALRIRRPDARIVFTFFSPSAERVSASVGADFAGYLPWDTAAHTGRAVAALRPAVVACVRTEVWPHLARATHEAGGAVALVNAVLSRSSGRLRPAARWLLAPTYRGLEAVGVVSERDEPLFRRLGVPAHRIRLTGDARFDQVWQRVSRLRDDVERLTQLRALVPEGRSAIVAGSTWPADEKHLAGATRALGADPSVRRPLWIIAPHEPTEEHLLGVERAFEKRGIGVTRLSAAEAGSPAGDALVVDRIGLLADLYAIADVAYVGGGFHGQGLHSVVEPAALGVPVLFGPRHGNAREAAELASARGGVQVDGTAALAAALRLFLRDGAARAMAGVAARRFVEQRLGGAERNAVLIADLIEPSRK